MYVPGIEPRSLEEATGALNPRAISQAPTLFKDYYDLCVLLWEYVHVLAECTREVRKPWIWTPHPHPRELKLQAVEGCQTCVLGPELSGPPKEQQAL